MIENLVPNVWHDDDLRGAERIGARIAAYAEGRLQYRKSDDAAERGWWHRSRDGQWVHDDDKTNIIRALHAVLGISEWLAEETDDNDLREDVAYARSQKGSWRAVSEARDRLTVGGEDDSEDADPPLVLESITDLI